jgi:biopolymer transport protein ExbD
MAGGGGQDEATNFDLTALMDVLSNIIFFLMASFGAAVVAGLPASVPTISDDAESDVATDLTKVTLTLQLKATGAVSASVANNELPPETLAPFAKTFEPANGKIDAKAVNDHIWSIKEKYRASKDVVIVPDDDVTYEMIIDLMDTARERHMVVEGKAVYPQMFPAVVVSSLVK